MGQYYHPIILGNPKKRGTPKIVAYFNSWDYDNGLKLMEHSYIGNHFMTAVEYSLSPKGKFYKSPLVWAGDYADEEKNGSTLYNMCEEDQAVKLGLDGIEEMKSYLNTLPFIVNHTKKQYVDKTKLPKDEDDSDPWQVHPLSLLTAEGNGRGGGDYWDDDDMIGTWARDVISIEETLPEGYTEIKPNFVSFIK